MGRFAPINSALLLPALFIQIPLLPLASSKAPRRRAAWRRSLELGPLSFSCWLFSSSRRFSSSTSLRRSSSAFFRRLLSLLGLCFFSSIAACWHQLWRLPASRQLPLVHFLFPWCFLLCLLHWFRDCCLPRERSLLWTLLLLKHYLNSRTLIKFLYRLQNLTWLQ